MDDKHMSSLRSSGKYLVKINASVIKIFSASVGLKQCRGYEAS